MLEDGGLAEYNGTEVIEMKALVMTGPRESRVVQVEIPTISDDQVLVKVKYTGMCHSEYYPWTVAVAGQTFGHETMGYVAAVGKNVTEYQVGDRVTGLGGGGYCEYIVMEPAKMMRVPQGLADEDAIVEPLGCLMSAGERMMPAQVGDTVAVVGAGYMGLGMISLFRAMGYAEVIAVDKRAQALENALAYGATRVAYPDEIVKEALNWETWKSPDLRRDGHKTDIFHQGFENVMEFTGTPDGLTLAGELVCAHGRLGIGGYHNDGPRTVDFKLWNMKAMSMYNCHERRILHEARLCRRALALIDRNEWKFRGTVRHIYTLEEFDRANQEMAAHTDNFIKGAIVCD